MKTETPQRLNQALTLLLEPLGVSQNWETVKLYGDASRRIYYRVSHAQQSWIAMVLPESGPSSLAEQMTKVSKQISEIPFIDVQRYLQTKKVKVPELLGYHKELGILLLEDFGDNLLFQAIQNASPTQIQFLYEKALEQLEKISFVSSKDPKTCVGFYRRFDRDLYNWEFDHFVEYALDHRIPKGLREHDRKRILSSFHDLTEQYLRWDQVFCHRDFHSRNLLILPSFSTEQTEIGVIDFQDALQAPLFYDLASLLKDSYVSLGEKTMSHLVEKYRLLVKPYSYQATQSYEEFRRAFDWMAIHRNLKAVGRFFYFDEVQKNSNYLQHVPRTLENVKTTIKTYPELQTLKESLLPYVEKISEETS